MESLYLLRFGELTLKSNQVRKRMVKKLIANIKDGLKRKDISFEIKREWSRIFVKTSEPEKAEQVFSNIFGLRSFSKMTLHKYETKESLLEFAEQHFADHVKDRSFAVRTRREKNLPISGQEINQELGSRLSKYARKVDLTHPEITCYLEIRQKQQVYLFIDKNSSPGGMPLGVEDRCLSLISGGFDSPVASWLISRRGVPLDYIFFELGGFPQRSAIYSLLAHLNNNWLYGHRPRLYIIPGEPLLAQLQDKIPEKFWNVMLKRIFYQVSNLLSERYHYTAIVTGEAIAQVSSQTLSNLRSIEYDVDIPILRPLLTYEKEDIINLSKKIGTHDISAHVKEYCAIASSKPATRSDPLYILELEEKLGSTEFYESLLAEIETIRLNQIEPNLSQFLDIVVESPPKDAIWIDLRESTEDKIDHPTLELQSSELSEHPEQLKQNQNYLLFCNGGMKSAKIAHELQEKGYQTYAYAGGISRLKKYILSIRKNPTNTNS